MVILYSFISIKLSIELYMIYKGLGKLIFITMELWGIDEMGPILDKCGSLLLAPILTFKVIDSVRFYKNLHVLVIILTMYLIKSPTRYLYILQ